MYMEIELSNCAESGVGEACLKELLAEKWDKREMEGLEVFHHLCISQLVPENDTWIPLK